MTKRTTLHFTTEDLTRQMQRDFLQSTDKQEMVSIGQLSEAMTSENTYLKDIFRVVERAKKLTDGDFFVEVIRTVEPGYRQMFRRSQFWTYACSTPQPATAIYHYHRKEEMLDLLWDLPPSNTINMVMRDPNRFPTEEIGDVMKYIFDYKNGTLHKRAKKINGEYNGKGSAVIRIVDDERLELERERRKTRRGNTT